MGPRALLPVATCVAVCVRASWPPDSVSLVFLSKFRFILFRVENPSKPKVDLKRIKLRSVE